MAEQADSSSIVHDLECTQDKDITASLPLELKHAVLDYVPQPFVRRVGAVSRDWRNAATSHPYFYVTLTCRLNPTVHNPCLALSTALSKAQNAGLRVSLSIQIEDLPNTEDSQDSLIGPLTQTLWLALSQMLVHISIVAPQDFIVGVLQALHAPAPLLRSLRVKRLSKSRELRPEVGVIDPSLFDGVTPLLKSVTLEEVHVSPGVPAFASVTHVVFSAHSFMGDLRFAAFFPAARFVEFTVLCTPSVPKGYGPPVVFDLRDLSLDKLHVIQETDMLVLRHLPSPIHSLSLLGFDTLDLSSYQAAVPGPLTWEIRLILTLGVLRQFATTARSFFSPCRYVTSSMTPSLDVPGGLEHLSARLGEVVELTIDQGVMRSALLSWRDAEMPLLRSLVITLDIVLRPLWPPQAHTVFSLWPSRDPPQLNQERPDAIPRFPALRELTIENLLSLGSRRPQDVEPDQVEALAHELGLKRFQCALKLVDVNWKPSPRPGTVETVFSTIVYTTRPPEGFGVIARSQRSR